MGTHSQVLKQLRSHPLEEGRHSVCLAPQGGTSTHWKKGLGRQILLHSGIRALQGECPAVKGQRSGPAHGPEGPAGTPAHATSPDQSSAGLQV